VSCRHCGLPVPPERLARGDRFCCAGCARVFELIRGEGLDRYYDLRGDAGAPPPDARTGSFAWLDPVLVSLSGDRPRTLALDLQGVHCAACVWLLRELFLRRDGAIELVVNPSRGVAELTFVPARFDVPAYLAEAERFGYRFGPRRKEERPHSSGLLVRLGVTVAAAMNVMLFSIAFYAGLGPEDGALYVLFGRLSLALTAIAVAVGGWVFLRAAVEGLRLGVVHLDLPIALGIVLAFAGSVWAHLAHGPRAAYFDTVAIFVSLMLVGRFLQERVLERNRASLLASDGVDGLVVRRVHEGGLETVPAARLAAGDELVVVPGDLVPVAAIVLGAPGEVALDWITGESEVRAVAAGEDVPAGAFNAGRTALRLAAAEPFAASRLHDLLGGPAAGAARPLDAASSWWRRLGTIYVVAVLALATLGLVAWLPRGLEPALRVTVAILVVTCPCALGLAVPLAGELTAVALRRAGVFLREPGFLDRALAVRTVLFDKTGTLTRGRLVLAPAGRQALAALSDNERAVLAAMAARSNHPASRALAAEVGGAVAGESPAGIDGLEETPGQGLEWRRDGRAWRLGRADFAVAGAAAPDGEAWFAMDGRRLAAFAFDEEIKPGVAAELAALAARGLDVRVLSGDAAARVRTVATAIGLPADRAEGGLSPEAKAARVRELDRRDTLMVGDGINDAPSFAAAFCTATPAVDRPQLPARADLYFLGDGISAVRHALEAAARWRRVVWANLAFALAYNAVALGLSFAGLVTPLLAAVLMPASSLTVVTHTIARLAGRRAAWRS